MSVSSGAFSQNVTTSNINNYVKKIEQIDNSSSSHSSDCTPYKVTFTDYTAG